MSHRKPAREVADSDRTLSGRLAAAFASLFFSLPAVALLWLLFNTHLAVLSMGPIPWSALAAGVAAVAVVAFLFPRVAGSLVGGLWKQLIRLGRCL